MYLENSTGSFRYKIARSASNLSLELFQSSWTWINKTSRRTDPSSIFEAMLNLPSSVVTFWGKSLVCMYFGSMQCAAEIMLHYSMKVLLVNVIIIFFRRKFHTPVKTFLFVIIVPPQKKSFDGWWNSAAKKGHSPFLVDVPPMETPTPMKLGCPHSNGNSLG